MRHMRSFLATSATFQIQNLSSANIPTERSAASAENRTSQALTGRSFTRIAPENGDEKRKLHALNFPELEEELDRLRVRKSELEDIVQHRTAKCPEVDPTAIVQLFQNAVENWNPENLKEILKSLITKIYAHVDRSYTVNVGVHISCCGGRI